MKLETSKYLIMRQQHTLMFIRSCFCEPKTGKQVIAFKLAKPLKECKDAVIYFTFETDQPTSSEPMCDD